MALHAHFEETAHSPERRGAPRRALRLDVAGDAAGSAGDVTIHDLSLTGVLIETAADLVPGETFEVALPHAGAVEATVAWSSGRFYGCQFRQPISPAALSAALLQSSPPEDTASAGTDMVAELRGLTAQIEKISRDVERAVSQLANARKDPRGP
jgi:PilZ domain